MIEQVSERGWRATFPSEGSSIAKARAFVATVIESWGRPVSHNLVLITSEAVSNSYQHTDTADVVVEVTQIGRSAHVSVTDEDPTRPVPRNPEPGEIGGHGMRLIAALADDWGIVDIQNDGKLVWFTVTLSEPS